MKNLFPDPNKGNYLQTNRSDDLGSLWSTFNLDFQTNLGMMLVSQKLVTNTTSSDDADLGRPVAFEYFTISWWAICGTRIFKNGSNELTVAFTENTDRYAVGDSTSQFDVTNPAGTTFRYTFDGTGTDPGITALTFPIGATVVVSSGTDFAAGNRGTFTVTGSGANYFEVTNASGVIESNKTLNTGSISVFGGSLGTNYSVAYSDLAIFNDRIWSTTTNALYSKTGTGNWIKRDDLELNQVHKLAYFKKFDRLYFADDQDTISSIDTADVVANSAGDYYISLGNSIGAITTMAASSQYIWIGTLKSSDGAGGGVVGSIQQWDGISAQVTNDYSLNAAGCLAIVVYNDVPYAVDSEGRFLKYTGYSFEEIGRLPVNRILLTGASSISIANGRFVHMNGLVATKNNTLQVLINNLNEDDGATINENLQSGIWELDLATGNCTHRYSPTLKTRASSTVTDFGQNRILGAGALKLNTLENDAAEGRSTLICGFSYYTDASTTKSAIYIDSPAGGTTEGQKRGYFVTTWFDSNEVQDKWLRLWAVFRRFLNSTDKIVFKYRLYEEAPIEATITWTSTTTFTTTTNVSAYAPTATGFNGTSGGEVEVVQGTGSGSCTHISNISEAGGTYTVTLDNVVTGATGTAKARFQKWVKMTPEITGQVVSYEQPAIGVSNARIQIKGVLEFTGDDEFQKFILISNEDIKATQ